MSLFIPKLQSQFAEFLQRSYLERLSIFYKSTCVGLQYGFNLNTLFPEKKTIIFNYHKNQSIVINKFKFCHIKFPISLYNL